MKYLLDTNACIDHLRRGFASEISKRLATVAAGDVCLCSVVRAKLAYGAHRSASPQLGMQSVLAFVSHFPSHSFDDAAADRYGELRAYLAVRGTPIGPNDLLIASIALLHPRTVVTTNIGEFSRVPGLSCEDWSKP